VVNRNSETHHNVTTNTTEEGKSEIRSEKAEGRTELQESGEFFDGHARLSNQSAQRTLGEFWMIRNRQATVRRKPVPQDYVASGLVVDFVAQVGENTDRIKTRGNG
jgi:hypothetical protein